MTSETLESVLKRLNQIEKRIEKLEGVDASLPVSKSEVKEVEKRPLSQPTPSQQRIKSTEKANPGYYEVNLEEDDIDVRLTTTDRVGVHEYTYNNKGSANLIIDLEHRDQLLDWSIKKTADNRKKISSSNLYQTIK